MDVVLIVVAGIATMFNFAIIKWKLENERYLDTTIDVGVLATVSYMFAGTISGLSIAMIASMLMSLFLLYSPPRFKFMEPDNNW